MRPAVDVLVEKMSLGRIFTAADDMIVQRSSRLNAQPFYGSYYDGTRKSSRLNPFATPYIPGATVSQTPTVDTVKAALKYYLLKVDTQIDNMTKSLYLADIYWAESHDELRRITRSIVDEI
jgi:hypothetical protein